MVSFKSCVSENYDADMLLVPSLLPDTDVTLDEYKRYQHTSVLRCKFWIQTQSKQTKVYPAGLFGRVLGKMFQRSLSKCETKSFAVLECVGFEFAMEDKINHFELFFSTNESQQNPTWIVRVVLEVANDILNTHFKSLEIVVTLGEEEEPLFDPDGIVSDKVDDCWRPQQNCDVTKAIDVLELHKQRNDMLKDDTSAVNKTMHVSVESYGFVMEELSDCVRFFLNLAGGEISVLKSSVTS